MAELALVLALGWLAGCLGSSPNAEFGDAGRYDSLVLARFWEPQVRNCKEWGRNELTLHGLWPQYSTHHTQGAPKGLPGDWPQFCGKTSKGPKFWNAVEPVPDAVKLRFLPDWASRAPEYVSGTLAGHEWAKHGTCYTAGLTAASVAKIQSQFFKTGLDLMEKYPTPPTLQDAQEEQQRGGGGMPLAKLQAAFGANASMSGLSCNRNKTSGTLSLNMVELCFGPPSRGETVGPRVPCPPLTLLASSYDNSCATQATGHQLIFVGQHCGPQKPKPSPSPPSPPGPPATTCAVGRHGPPCKTDADCKNVPLCVRCAHSGFCTTEPVA